MHLDKEEAVVEHGQVMHTVHERQGVSSKVRSSILLQCMRGKGLAARCGRPSYYCYYYYY